MAVFQAGGLAPPLHPTYVMGVLNGTPHSFSHGGRDRHPQAPRAHAPQDSAPPSVGGATRSNTRLQERKLRLEGHLEKLPPVLADDRLLTLVFRNLLENACRYAEEETAIRVTGRVEGDDVVIRVVDDGVLIPADDLPRIFERFYQVERHRGQNSTGLGLAICKHVIERHGGRIWAESPAEDGSTAIIFTLRRADAPRTPVQE